MGSLKGMPMDVKNADIRFALATCSLGSVLVAQSDRGICAILLGDEVEAMTRDLEFRFPDATLIHADSELGPVVAEVTALVEAPKVGLALPLDVRGSSFQQRVWQALREIPAGKTASYSEIAQRIGAPGSAKEVGEACAANALAVAIPCHRVVKKNGGLAGYRWGVRRKRALLEREARA
jgi:AraC family transcriptional regulator of adaptative response/methylated-DNA-[protein]-cysteine methyltransferase